MFGWHDNDAWLPSAPTIPTVQSSRAAESDTVWACVGVCVVCVTCRPSTNYIRRINR